MSRSFAIGDIHGCAKTLRKMLLEEIRIQKQDRIYCLGDFVDRGRDSKGVIDFILEMREKGFKIHTLRGNHEQMMMDSAGSMENFMLWIKNGGDATLKSFGITSYHDLQPAYKNFLHRTKFVISSGDYLLVHAGLNFHSPDPFEDREAMLWIRDFYIDPHQLGNRTILHGHTPRPLPVILSQQGMAINLYGGCVYNLLHEYGNLVAWNMTERKFVVVRNSE